MNGTPSDTQPARMDVTALARTACDALTARGVNVVNIGWSRAGQCRDVGESLMSMWTAKGGQTGATVSWPEQAASRLRPAPPLPDGGRGTRRCLPPDASPAHSNGPLPRRVCA